MKAKISQYMSAVPDTMARTAIETVLKAVGDRVSSQTLSAAGLRIKGASASAIVQAHTAIYASCRGVLVTKAADTDMAALSGTVANAAYNVYAFFIDGDGTLTSAMGTAGASLAAVSFPLIPEGKACVGFVIIHPSGTGNFVGGTTQLDDGTVVPNAAFIDINGGFDPAILL
jgi:hypothetical protein